MSLTSLLNRLHKALPVVIAHIPAVKQAVREVKEAVKKEKKPSAGKGA